jgi:hypothetical protein
MPKLRRTVTPARLAANRLAAIKSTGPRTARGKQRSSLNALRSGRRSHTIKLLWQILMTAPPCGVIRMARQLMTPAQLSHPDVTYQLNMCRAEGDVPIEPDPGGIQFLEEFLYGNDQHGLVVAKQEIAREERRSKPKTPLE